MLMGDMDAGCKEYTAVDLPSTNCGHKDPELQANAARLASLSFPPCWESHPSSMEEHSFNGVVVR